MTLACLQRRRETLRAIDLRARVQDMAARLHIDREEQRFRAARMKAIQTMTQEEIAVPLLQLEDQIATQRETVKRLQLAAWRARSAFHQAEQLLEQADRECQSAFVALQLLEASERTLREDISRIGEAEGNPDLRLVEVTDEEIEERANGLIRGIHADKLREIDAQIVAILWPQIDVPCFVVAVCDPFPLVFHMLGK